MSLRTSSINGHSQEEKEKAAHSFGMWHGISEFANLIVLADYLIHITRVSRPPNETNQVRHLHKIPGLTKLECGEDLLVWCVRCLGVRQ